VKTIRLLLSLVGLVAISLAYITHDLYFLVVAIGAFVAGLYFMGAIGRQSGQNQKLPPKKDQRAGKKNQNDE
jgi:hypothetical protein